MEPVKGGVLSPSETATGHDHLINDLDDVETAGAEEGDALVFTGDGWVPGAVATGTAADEVQIRTDQPRRTPSSCGWTPTRCLPVAFALGKVAIGRQRPPYRPDLASDHHRRRAQPGG